MLYIEVGKACTDETGGGREWPQLALTPAETSE